MAASARSWVATGTTARAETPTTTSAWITPARCSARRSVVDAAHVHAAATLTIMNRKARPTTYQSPRDYVAVNFASRSMRYTGVIVLGYLVFHLLDLTIGPANPDFVHGQVHDNMIASMQRWPVAIAYIICNIAVAVHLYHGTWSMFQSLGLNNPRYNAFRKAFATGITAIVGIGNVLFPILIVTRVVK